jgi:hypothetical protein
LFLQKVQRGAEQAQSSSPRAAASAAASTAASAAASAAASTAASAAASTAASTAASADASQAWPVALASYIRNNDTAILESVEKTVQRYEQELLPAESVVEFLDMVGMLEELNTANSTEADPACFVDDTLKMLRN